ncbi:MaoC family dehydratase [Jeotgalibaca sp. A127]|uniref:MaoC family dehydratase n=1 Tax=Jeotgalibaca sp. A127 TaxID=3457324 RepID=UPI003FD15548
MKDTDVWLGECEVGDYYVSDTYEVTEEEIITFAKQYDPQHFHLDAEKAKDSFFKGLASSGWLTAGIMMKLQVESNPFGFDLVGVEVKLEWPSPTRPGDILQIRTEILDIKMSRSKPEQGILTVETITKNQDGEIRMVMQNKILGFVRPQQ